MGFEYYLKWITGVLYSLAELFVVRVLKVIGRAVRADELTVVLISCGETTYDKCLAAINNQTIPVIIKTVRDVHPLSASLDAALDACDTKWLLMVDADTIIHPYCVEVMCGKLKPGVGMVVAKLFDKVYGPIGYLRLVDAGTLKKHQFRHPKNDPYPDRKARDYLLQQKLKRVVLKSTLGVHNPYGTSFEAFRRFYGTYRKRDSSERRMDVHVQYILKYAGRSKAWREVYYMMAGLVCGALVDPDKPRDYKDDSEMLRHFEAISQKDIVS